VTDFRKRLGLGFMKKGDQQAPDYEKGVDTYLQDALLAIAPKLLEALLHKPDRSTTVFTLVDELGESVAVLNPVIENLRQQGYVDLLQEDPKGDHTVRLTDRGAKVAS
jgi:hypothetical protein